MTSKDKLRILDYLETRWKMTKENCDHCIPDELIDWCKEIKEMLIKEEQESNETVHNSKHNN